MSLRVSVKPELFKWAIERSNKDRKQLKKKFNKISEWIKGTTRPTLKQLENFAKSTYVPLGYFFLEKPPKEDLPIPDFRTIKNVEISRPSPHLLDTIYQCQQRQTWYRDLILSGDGEKLKFVGSINQSMPVPQAAKILRNYFGLDQENDDSHRTSTREGYLKSFIEKARKQGVLVMVNSIVGSNTHRKLDVNEFRGFAISDELAPLIFINGADSKSAQMFTLAHELAHLGLGKSALSNSDLISNISNSTEVWCNKVAAEFLVPLKDIKKEQVGNNPLDAVQRLTKNYKVSSLVIMRRLLDAGYIDKNKFEKAYKKEINKLKIRTKKGGGDFYKTLQTRIGERFTQDIVISALEGQTSFTDALDLLGIKKMDAFDKIAKKFGIVLE